MIITVCALKGGGSKTVTAMLASEGLARLGYSVVYNDLDPQGSGSDWHAISVEDGEGDDWRFEVRSLNASELRRLKNDPDTIQVLDLPNDPTLAHAAIKKSDLTILPVAPQPLESDRLITSLDSLPLTDDSAYRILITRARGGFSTLRQETEELLDDEGLNRFPGFIPMRDSISRLFGFCPADADLCGYQFVARDIDKFIKESETLTAKPTAA